jgi:Uma2 family endonuclease
MESAVRPPVFETKPATEWLMGRPVQKVSPRYAHALMQRLVAERLGAWARGRGRVGTEWRFWVTPAGEGARYLIPDVAYLSYAKLARDRVDDAEEPAVAPDAVFEIRSRDDREELIAHKVDVYMRSGCNVVVILDPSKRELLAYGKEGVSRHAASSVFTHPALGGFSLSLPELFDELDDVTGS